MKRTPVLMFSMLIFICTGCAVALSPPNGSTLPSGDETATQSGQAARQASQEDRTGVIFETNRSDVELPAPADGAEVAAVDPVSALSVTLLAQGTIRVGDQETDDLQELRTWLEEYALMDSPELIVEAPLDAPFSSVSRIVEIARQVGISHIVLRASEEVTPQNSSSVN